MAKLAETIVEEWLNRKGYFTIRGVKEGVSEIDLLAVKPRETEVPEALHVEVQFSVRPVSYISKLTKNLRGKLRKAAGSAYGRNSEELKECVDGWIKKKFTDPKKVKRREFFWPGLDWGFVFIHGRVKHEEELGMIGSSTHDIKLIPFEKILTELCSGNMPKLSGSAAGDLAEIIKFYGENQ